MRRSILAILILPMFAAVATGGQLCSQEPFSEAFGYSSEDFGGGSYLGVDTRDVTSDRLADLKLKEEHGVEVTLVDQDAPAAVDQLWPRDRLELDAVADAAKGRYPGLPVSCSADVVAEYREFERFSTTVLNAYLQPLMDGYLAGLEEQLRAIGYAHGVLTVASSGGMMTTETARRLPIKTIFSGPAGGVSQACFVGAAAGVQDLITYAGHLGLDEVKFAEMIQQHRYAVRVEADLEAGLRRGIRGSPVIFVNGNRIDGVPSLDKLVEFVESELTARDKSRVRRP